MIHAKKWSLREALWPDTEPKWLLWAALPVLLGVGLLLGLLSSFMLVVYAASAIVLGYLFVRKQYAWLAVIMIAVGVFIDFFILVPLPFQAPDLATIIAFLFLAAAFLMQSSARPWIRVPHVGWWIVVLILTLPPAIRGGLLVSGGKYYVEIYLDALLMYMVGVQVARDLSQVRRLFILLSGFAVLIAIHSILQAETRHVLLPIHYWDNYLASVNDFALAGSKDIRAGSFFIDPDSDGTFLAVLLLLPLTLLLETPSRLLKGLYAVEAIIILLGLFFTYSLIAIAAVCLGGILFVLLVGKGRYRFYLLGITGALIVVIFVAFPKLLHLLLSHLGAAGNEISLRLGAWETALRVILAYPLTGLGFGFHAYENGAEPYRVALQYRPLPHPHNSFLEFAAMAGIPVLLLMLIIFGKSYWQAFQNYRGAGRSQRIFIGGGISTLVVLTLNSLANNSWTFPPLVLLGWLLFGVLCSPALLQPLRARLHLEERHAEEARQADEITAVPGGVQV